ncbi:MAG TPA: (S)-ureidoglycine aminohydrolase [Anaerolineales bacterium]
MQTEKFIISDADVVSRCRAITKTGSYSLLPRANRVMSTLPGFKGVQAQVLAARPLSNYYVAHELVVSTNGSSDRPIVQDMEQFLYVLEGQLDLSLDGETHHLVGGGYCWLPPQLAYEFSNRGEAASRVLWLRRKYIPVEGLQTPSAIISNEKDVVAFPEDTYMEQHLVPYEDPAHDMGFNLLSFEPGTYFGFVESHIMEHALYMLQGRGIYWLNNDFVEVQKDDFIFMAPYCPQFFYATGWETSRYMVYKDVNRDYVFGL